MTGNSEYDAIGELFRRRLENHRMPVDDNDWDEIERRMGKRKKNKAATWLWSAGAMAVAAAIAALVIFNGPATDEASVMTVSQQVIPEESTATNLETASSTALSNTDKISSEATSSKIFAKPNLRAPQRQSPKGDFRKAHEDNSSPLGVGGEPREGSKATSVIVSDTINQDGLLVATAENSPEQPEEDEPVVAQAEKEIPKLDISLVEDKPDEVEETDTKEGKKWLLVAALGTGGYTDGFSDSFEEPKSVMDSSPGWSGLGSGNQFASDKSSSIVSFNNMSREDFKNISHSPPLSFGVTARKSLGRHGGVESGLVYTYLSSQFEWRNFDVHQSLHYIGIPLNMVVYLWQTKPNWRIYLSGGVMVEKGLRGIYRQEAQGGNEIRTTIVKSSSIDGLQWSLNGGLGINYRFNKGLGIYFEPRAGYAFDCDQPISMRTEWPIFIGINMGLNYEF